MGSFSSLDLHRLLHDMGFSELAGDSSPLGKIAGRQIFTGQHFSIRLTDDRGLVYVDVGPPFQKDEFYWFEHVDRCLNLSPRPSSLSRHALPLVKKCYEELKTFFSSKDFRKRLGKMERNSWAEFDDKVRKGNILQWRK